MRGAPVTGSAPSHSERKQSAPSRFWSCVPVDGESDSVFCFGPPGDALLMTLTPPVGGLPLAVPNSKTSAAWESGIGAPAVSVAPKL